MAPEVWAGGAYSHTADVFSFAILAFELLSRKRGRNAGGGGCMRMRACVCVWVGVGVGVGVGMFVSVC